LRTSSKLVLLIGYLRQLGGPRCELNGVARRPACVQPRTSARERTVLSDQDPAKLATTSPGRSREEIGGAHKSARVIRSQCPLSPNSDMKPDMGLGPSCAKGAHPPSVRPPG